MHRLEAMSILAAAVDTGGFSAASRRLGVPLPTVSRKVADLEKHLKAKLLVRSTRKLALTDAGASYLAASKRILEQVDDAEAAAAGEYSTPRGEPSSRRRSYSAGCTSCRWSAIFWRVFPTSTCAWCCRTAM